MNKLNVLDGIRDQHYGESFELVKKQDSNATLRKRKSSKAESKEITNIMVKCKDDLVKNELVKLITQEVDKLKKFADILANPTA